MAADGSVIINTLIDTKGFGKGVTNLKSQLGQMGSVVKKLGGIIAVAFGVNSLVQFGKEAIELGSDLQEVQNVVDVTFTTLNQQVNAFAQTAARTAGLSETMAKQYIGTFGAMAKSFKFTEAEAYEMSTSLTQLAGDVASFYNLDQKAAYTKLKSVFTGETESLKDLGVVMTQTALDAFALEKGFGKITNQMTEQEKVALRYQFVTEQLTAASGDFLRTSNSWANQTRVLKLQFDSLKATIGQGLINAFTPAIKVINTVLAGLQKVAAAFRQFTVALFGDASAAEQAQNTAAGYGAAAENAEELADATTAAGKAAKKATAGFDELNVLSSGSAGAGTEAAAFGGGIGADFTIGGEVKDEISPKLQAIVDKIKQFIEPLKQINLAPLTNSLAKLKAALNPLKQNIFAGLEWAWWNVFIPLATWTVEDLLPEFLNLLAGALTVLNSVLAAFKPLGQWLWTNFLQPIAKWTGGTIVKILNGLATALTTVGNWIRKHQTLVQNIALAIGSFAAAWGTLNSVVSLWNKAATTAKAVGAALKVGFAALSSPVTLVIAGIAALIAVIVLLVKNWDKVKEVAANVWGKIQDIWGAVATWFGKNVRDPIVGVWDGIINGIKSRINSLIGFINRMISGIAGGINAIVSALNSINFTLPDWIPSIGGQSFGLNLGYVSAPQIPYLAKGAVIPPNAPFTAVLGDQRHGTNIEAPLETIKQAFAEVLASQGSGDIKISFTGDLAQLGRVLKPVIDREDKRRGTGLVKGAVIGW